MQPILFAFGPFIISSFGLFLALGVFAAVFVSWRLAKLYDLSEEKIVDLAILTFFGGIIGARIFFVLTHWGLFNSFDKIILLNRYPGISFWGGLLGGILAFWFFAGRLKFNFWQVADFAAVSLLVGMVFGDIGCFLSGCSYGIVSTLPIATPVVGVIGKRLPITAIEGLILLPLCFHFWKQTVRFHFAGKIISLLFLSLGIVKLGTEYYRGDTRLLINIWGRVITQGYLFAALLLVAGIVVFYRQSRRNLWLDIRGFFTSLFVAKKRQVTLSKFRQNWYNQTVNWKIRTNKIIKLVRKLPKNTQKKLNVKPNPTDIK